MGVEKGVDVVKRGGRKVRLVVVQIESEDGCKKLVVRAWQGGGQGVDSCGGGRRRQGSCVMEEENGEGENEVK